MYAALKTNDKVTIMSVANKIKLMCLSKHTDAYSDCTAKCALNAIKFVALNRFSGVIVKRFSISKVDQILLL